MRMSNQRTATVSKTSQRPRTRKLSWSTNQKGIHLAFTVRETKSFTKGQPQLVTGMLWRGTSIVLMVHETLLPCRDDGRVVHEQVRGDEPAEGCRTNVVL